MDSCVHIILYIALELSVRITVQSKSIVHLSRRDARPPSASVAAQALRLYSHTYYNYVRARNKSIPVESLISSRPRHTQVRPEVASSFNPPLGKHKAKGVWRSRAISRSISIHARTLVNIRMWLWRWCADVKGRCERARASF